VLAKGSQRACLLKTNQDETDILSNETIHKYFNFVFYLSLNIAAPDRG
jgi:hypothetical protein